MTRVGIEIPKRLQLRRVIRIVGERYRGKYKEERERDAKGPGLCGICVPVSTSAFGNSCVVRGFE